MSPTDNEKIAQSGHTDPLTFLVSLKEFREKKSYKICKNLIFSETEFNSKTQYPDLANRWILRIECYVTTTNDQAGPTYAGLALL